jgi:hypothetical protein
MKGEEGEEEGEEEVGLISNGHFFFSFSFSFTFFGDVRAE